MERVSLLRFIMHNIHMCGVLTNSCSQMLEFSQNFHRVQPNVIDQATKRSLADKHYIYITLQQRKKTTHIWR